MNEIYWDCLPDDNHQFGLYWRNWRWGIDPVPDTDLIVARGPFDSYETALADMRAYERGSRV